MSKLKVELNSSGIRALLRSQAMAAICAQKANERRTQLGSGYEVETYTAQTRAVSQVYTEDPAAIDGNLKNNTMLKAMGGQSPRQGRQVSGYWRTTKGGKRVYVQSYQRRK